MSYISSLGGVLYANVDDTLSNSLDPDGPLERAMRVTMALSSNIFSDGDDVPVVQTGDWHFNHKNTVLVALLNIYPSH